jgi:hypothetical protein
MHGQWTGKIAGEFGGTLRIELEDRGSALFGTAYLFYDLSHKLPGFRFPVRIPKTAPHSTRVETTYLYADGGAMTVEQRKSAEADLTARFGELPISLNGPEQQTLSFALWTSDDANNVYGGGTRSPGVAKNGKTTAGNQPRTTTTNCNGNDNAAMNVRFTNARLLAAVAGTYTGTLTFVVSPL